MRCGRRARAWHARPSACHAPEKHVLLIHSLSGTCRESAQRNRKSENTALAPPLCTRTLCTVAQCDPCCANAIPWLPAGVAIARALEAAGAASRLAQLNLSRNDMGSPVAEAFGTALAAQGPGGALRALNLSNNRIGPPGATLLAKGLRVSSSLETLDLGRNSIGVVGANAIAAATGGTGTKRGGPALGLTTLSLSRNGLPDTAAAEMVEAGLGQNAPSLTELDLTLNHLNEESCVALARWAEVRFGVATPETPSTGKEKKNKKKGAAAGAAAAAAVRAPPLRISIGLDRKVVRARVVGSVGRIVEHVNAAVDSAGWLRSGKALKIDLSFPHGWT